MIKNWTETNESLKSNQKSYQHATSAVTAMQTGRSPLWSTRTWPLVFLLLFPWESWCVRRSALPIMCLQAVNIGTKENQNVYVFLRTDWSSVTRYGLADVVLVWEIDDPKLLQGSIMDTIFNLIISRLFWSFQLKFNKIVIQSS